MRFRMHCVMISTLLFYKKMLLLHSYFIFLIGKAVFAWSFEEHELTGHVAQEFLSPESAEVLRSLLNIFPPSETVRPLLTLTF
jgi:hypothetical protein